MTSSGAISRRLAVARALCADLKSCGRDVRSLEYDLDLQGNKASRESAVRVCCLGTLHMRRCQLRVMSDVQALRDTILKLQTGRSGQLPGTAGKENVMLS